MSTQLNGHRLQLAEYYVQPPSTSTTQGQVALPRRGASSTQGQALPSADGRRGAYSTQGQAMPSADARRGAPTGKGQLLRSPKISDTINGVNVGVFRRINVTPLDALKPQILKIVSDPKAPVNSIRPTLVAESAFAKLPRTSSNGPSKYASKKYDRAQMLAKAKMSRRGERPTKHNVTIDIERERPMVLMLLRFFKIIYYLFVWFLICTTLLRMLGLYLDHPKGEPLALPLACAPLSMGYVEGDLAQQGAGGERMRQFIKETLKPVAVPPRLVGPEEANTYNILIGDRVCTGEGACFVQTTTYLAGSTFTSKRHARNGTTFSHTVHHLTGMFRVYVYQCAGQWRGNATDPAASPYAAHLDVTADPDTVLTTVVRDYGVFCVPDVWRDLAFIWDTITLWN